MNRQEYIFILGIQNIFRTVIKNKHMNRHVEQLLSQNMY